LFFSNDICFDGCRTDELKWGELIGIDKFGNKYYQNKMYFMGKTACITEYCYVLAAIATSDIDGTATSSNLWQRPRLMTTATDNL